jgi:hypothetical protein
MLGFAETGESNPHHRLIEHMNDGALDGSCAPENSDRRRTGAFICSWAKSR